MQLLLRDVADVIIGHTLRGPDAAKQRTREGLHLLRISDLSPSGELHIEQPHFIDPSDVDDRYRVRKGDVIVANRGSRITAGLIPPGLEAVAGGQLFVIRLKDSRILPAYLHWFLNLPTSQEYLRSHARGTYVKTLSVSVLRDLRLPPIPDMETQTKIADLSALEARERLLVAELTRKRQEYLQAAYSRILNDRLRFRSFSHED